MKLEGQNASTFKAALEAFIADCGGVLAASTKLGVSRATVYNWRKTPCMPDNLETLKKLGLDLEANLKSSKARSTKAKS